MHKTRQIVLPELVDTTIFEVMTVVDNLNVVDIDGGCAGNDGGDMVAKRSTGRSSEATKRMCSAHWQSNFQVTYIKKGRPGE